MWLTCRLGSSRLFWEQLRFVALSAGERGAVKEGRQNSSLKMRKGEVYAAAGPSIREDGGNES